LSCTHCRHFAFPFNTELFMSHLPPKYVLVRSAVPTSLEVPLGAAYACANQQNALTSWVHCSSISCPFTWYSCMEEQCTQEVNSLYQIRYTHTLTEPPDPKVQPTMPVHTWEGGVHGDMKYSDVCIAVLIGLWACLSS